MVNRVKILLLILLFNLLNKFTCIVAIQINAAALRAVYWKARLEFMISLIENLNSFLFNILYYDLLALRT